jgi:Na+/H+ antiporter NhaD/arsenite permease-like protein
MVLKNFVKNEWLPLISFSGMLFTSVYLQRLPVFTLSDAELLYILFILFVVTSGLQTHGLISELAIQLKQGRFIATKMVGGTFFLSMFVTNDVALIALVPLTLLLEIEHTEWLIILEILAANAGSALSPFGNPQNLFIYWYYQISVREFITSIAAFSTVFFVLLIFLALLIDKKETTQQHDNEKSPFVINTSSYIYLALLFFVVLIVLRILPLASGVPIILYALLFDRKSLRIDYALLLTFWCFFGFTDNLEVLLSNALSHSHHVFILAALLSQVISNVPTALLLADFTKHWQALLWGVSTGGFGSLVASLANLIAYRIYTKTEKHKSLSFILKFHLAGYTAFFIGSALYFFLYLK